MTEKSEHRQNLEARAEKVGLTVPHNIGDEKLEARVIEAEAAASATSTPVSNEPSDQGAGHETPPASTELTAVPVVVVRGPKKGRRRAGRQFGPEPVVFQPGELTEEELMAIEADPVLSLVVRAADT